MKIAINKLHFPVTTLGYGRRVGIWMQGCSIQCPGCVSKDTWHSSAEHEVDVTDCLDCCDRWFPEADGVTISGGEPFDQPEALLALLCGLSEGPFGDILVYSGFPASRLRQNFPSILERVDVLISEPYRADAGGTLMWRGSDNQRVALLTDLARKRYPVGIDHAPWPDDRRMDVMMSGDEFWMAGIPRPGEMDRLRVKLRAAGFTCRSSDQPEVRA